MSTSVVSLRLSEEERTLLEAASEFAGSSLSDFIRSKALEAAEAAVRERRVVTIPAKDWDAFKAWANRPAEEIEGLRDLADSAPAWRT